MVMAKVIIVIITVYFHFYRHEFSATTDSHNNFLTPTDKNFISHKSSIWGKMRY